jgi:hypothetical protein
MADNLERVFLQAQNPSLSIACLKLNQLTSGHLKQFSSRRSSALANRQTEGLTDTPTVDGNDGDEGVDLVRALDFLLNESVNNLGSIPNANALALLLQRSTDLSKNASDIIAAEAFKLLAAKKTAMSKQPAQNLVSLPKVTDMDWALGVTVGSSNSAIVQSPCVSILLHVKNPDGSLHTEGIEMSIQQMKAMEASLDEADLSMERA